MVKKFQKAPLQALVFGGVLQYRRLIPYLLAFRFHKPEVVLPDALPLPQVLRLLSSLHLRLLCFQS